jgi:hypothetical protein
MEQQIRQRVRDILEGQIAMGAGRKRKTIKRKSAGSKTVKRKSASKKGSKRGGSPGINNNRAKMTLRAARKRTGVNSPGRYGGTYGGMVYDDDLDSNFHNVPAYGLQDYNDDFYSTGIQGLGTQENSRYGGKKKAVAKKRKSCYNTNPWLKFVAAFRKKYSKKYIGNPKQLISDAGIAYRKINGTKKVKKVKRGGVPVAGVLIGGRRRSSGSKRGGVLIGGAKSSKSKPKGALAALLQGLNANISVD